MPESLHRQVVGRSDVELFVVEGVSPVDKARNEGLRRTTGEYIAWVDSDDEVADDWLSGICAVIASQPDVIVIGHTWMTNEMSGIDRAWNEADLVEDILKYGVRYGELWNTVIRRELWDDVRFDDNARTMEDWETIPCVLARAKKVVSVAKPLYKYMARQESLTHQADESMQREVFVRAVGRIAGMKRLGLWDKYGRATQAGVGYAVYCCAETLVHCGKGDSPTKRDAVRWIRQHLMALLMSPARRTYKMKWVLAAFGWWGVVKWYYRRQGRILYG